MGLKLETGYNVSALGITIPTAYAKIQTINIDKDGNAKAIAEIQQTRADIGVLKPLEAKEVNYVDDKLWNTFELAYTALKGILADWEDDIPVAETPVEVPTEEPII